MPYVFFLGGRVMNVDEYKQVLSGCLDALVSANTALAEWGIHVTAFRMTPPCLDVAMPAASGFHSINITAPPGIPGNSGTEADGRPSVFHIALVNMDGSIECVDSVDSVDHLLDALVSANTALAEWGTHMIPGNSGTEADGSIDSVDSVNRLLNEVLYLVAPASRTVTD